MSIRKAQVNDASDIKQLVSSLSHFYLEDTSSFLPSWFSKTLTLSEFERRLSDGEFTNFVYIENNFIIGYISIKGKNHLYHLFVAEDHQGKGISKRLWNFTKSDIGASNYTVRSSIYAIPVYKNFGFKESEPLTSKDGVKFQPMELLVKC